MVMALASKWVVSRRLVSTSFWKASFHLRRGLRMFSPARLMTTSQRGSPDLLSSLHVIRPGPGCRETNVTSWPLAFSSWVRAVPMNPVPPPDGRAQTVASPGGGGPERGGPAWYSPQGPPPRPPPRGAEVTPVTGFQGLGNQGSVACLEDRARWGWSPALGLAQARPPTLSPPSPTSTRMATGHQHACARFKHRTRLRASAPADFRARRPLPAPTPTRKELQQKRRRGEDQVREEPAPKGTRADPGCQVPAACSPWDSSYSSSFFPTLLSVTKVYLARSFI